jgi:hypothetical protein
VTRFPNSEMKSGSAAAKLFRLIPLAVSAACSGSNGPPARLVGGSSDTVIINNRREVRIPTRVLDRAGHTLPDSGVRYRLIAGNQIVVSSTGMVTCLRSADATVQASLGTLATTMLVRCRPVKTVYIDGPIQFLLPDTAQELPLRVADLDGNEVSLLSGRTDIIDTTVATIDGIRVIPKAPGATVAGARFGNESAGVGVHVYEKVSSLDALQQGKKFVGVSLRLAGGEIKTWELPPGSWMLTMLPESDEVNGLRLRIEGASCSPLQLTRRRVGCFVKTTGRVIVYNPSTSVTATTLTGALLVRPIYN